MDSDASRVVSSPSSGSSISLSSTNSSTSGYLHMQDASNGEFVNYWFLLHENSFTYSSSSPSDSSSDSSPLGSISLEGSSVEIVPESKYKSSFTFELNCPLDARTYVLQSSSSVELQDWMNNLRRAMLRIRRDKAKAAVQSRREKREENGTNASLQVNPSSSIILSSSSVSSSVDLSSSTVVNSIQPTPTTNTGNNGNGADKYSVYRQWLEETKESKQRQRGSSAPSTPGRPQTPTGAGGMHNRLLDENEGMANCQMCGVDFGKCSIQ
jgi:hypothetical protein